MIRFTVQGRPVPKARPVIPRKGKPFTRKTTLDYEKKVRQAYLDSNSQAYLEGQALTADIRYYFKIPKNTSKKDRLALLDKPWYTKKVDLDNLAKSVLDGLNTVAFSDDSQIVCLYLTKVYDTKGLGERVEVLIGEV